MKTCPNCGTTLENEAAFCAQCGTNITNAPVMQDVQTPVSSAVQTPVCPNCGTQLGIDDAFCQECGTPVGRTADQLAGLPTAAAVRAVKAVGREAEKHQFFSTKVILIATVAVVVIAAVIIGLFMFGSSAKNHLLYLKDDELNMTALDKIQPLELTDGLYDGSGNAGYYLYAYIQFSDDGKYMFYPESMSEYDDMDLYCLNLKADNTKENSAFKIDSEVNDYKISLNGTKVFYLKNNKLYLHNLKEKVKIDSDVYEFHINGDGTQLLYVTNDDDLYIYDMKSGDSVKIDSDARLEYVTEDLGKIYYLKNDVLYLKEPGKDKAKIDSDVSGVISVFDSGGLYYITSDTKTVPLSDYVTDDMTSDAVMTEPDHDDYVGEDSYGYTTFDSDAYYEAWDAYYEKQERDALREELKYNTYSLTKSSLYYFDGKAAVKVADDYSTYMTAGLDKAMLVYSKFSSADMPAFKLSEITSYYDVQSALDTALNSSDNICMAVEGKETALDLESADNFRFNKAGTSLYYLENASGDSYDMYALAISGDTAGAPELYDEDVSYDYFIINDSEAVVYFKDMDTYNNSGDLYINKNYIDTDVCSYFMRFNAGEKVNLLYMVDFDTDDNIGTLKKYDGKKPVKIADDVRDFVTNDSGTIAYLTNFDTDDYVGDAYLYNGSKPKLIDEEVSYLLMIQ